MQDEEEILECAYALISTYHRIGKGARARLKALLKIVT